MLRISSRVRHHTPEQVEEYVNEALRIIDSVVIDTDLRGIAFAKAVDLLAAHHLEFEQIQAAIPNLNAGQLG